VRLENDIKLLEKSPADVLFLPDTGEVYSEGLSGLEDYDLGRLENILEGKYRPGHFQGVCQVMDRLLKIVRPAKLFMGQKDYQQCMVVNRLLDYLDFPVDLIKCPTVREADGLAMSSRNLRLTQDQRAIAPLIYKTMVDLKKKISAGGDLLDLKKEGFYILEKNSFKPDYFEIADAATLEPVLLRDEQQSLVILAAAFVGEVRLIDNLLV
jgi:pantoate--beta-alanine ligase